MKSIVVCVACVACVAYGVLVAGCSDYPGGRSTDTVKMTSKPSWGDLTSQEIPFGGDCHIDSINDKSGELPIVHTAKPVENALKISGWTAISVKQGIVASDVSIALRKKSDPGYRLFSNPAKVKRADVAEYFKAPASVDTGFKPAIDLSGVPFGDYELEVIQHKDGKVYKCPMTASIRIEQ